MIRQLVSTPSNVLLQFLPYPLASSLNLSSANTRLCLELNEGRDGGHI
jgi:hypothetical protein